MVIMRIATTDPTIGPTTAFWTVVSKLVGGRLELDGGAEYAGSVAIGHTSVAGLDRQHPSTWKATDMI